MNPKFALIKRGALVLLFANINSQFSTYAQGAAFTYQGRLNDGASPASGNYDFRFSIFDSTNNPGVLIAGPITNAATAVSNGLFTVMLDFGNPFTGPDRWLEIGVRTNKTGSFNTLTPRQKMTPAPYAIYAPNAGVASYANDVIPSAILHAQALQVGVNNFSTSASATIAGGANNTTDGTYASIGGGLQNTAIGPSASVSGGFGNRASGDHATVSGGENNQAVGTHAFIGGGSGNSARGYDVVVGGLNNTVGADKSGIGSGDGNNVPGFASWIGGGQYNIAFDNYSVVGGGQSNRALGWASAVAGGSVNLANNPGTFVGGGTHNIALYYNAAVLGGYGNMAEQNFSAIGGGLQNTNQSLGGYIGGGYTNYAEGLYVMVGGGSGNRATGAVSVIGGGSGNLATGYGATISGGQQNSTTNGAFVFVEGGQLNDGTYSVIGGGLQNDAGGFAAAVGGGLQNQAMEHYATIAGGIGNVSSGLAAAVGGGEGNLVPGDHATVGGGSNNSATGTYATVPGGYGNLATGLASFAAGFNAKAVHPGSFVWSDQSGGDFYSTTENQFSIRALGGVNLSIGTPLLWSSGGVLVDNQGGSIELGNSTQIGDTPFVDFHFGFGSTQDYNVRIINDGPDQLTIKRSGSATPMAQLSPGGMTVNGALVITSDRNQKENFQSVDAGEVLAKVTALPLTKWNYKENKSSTHIGPMAQDFYAAFGVGPDDKHIATVDADGVALAAIQGLNQKLQEKDEAIEALQRRVERLETMLSGEDNKTPR